MSSRPVRKKNKIDWEGLKAAREGKVSALDQLEEDEDDNVYDIVKEEEYAKLVETRRNAGDFVVDDDGIGYYDDGEEHLGFDEDPYDAKKRLSQAIDESDSKIAKKARKLAEYTQSNNILNYTRPNVSATASVTQKAKPSSKSIDIDNLFDDLEKSTAGLSAKRNPSSKPISYSKKSSQPVIKSFHSNPALKYQNNEIKEMNETPSTSAAQCHDSDRNYDTYDDDQSYHVISDSQDISKNNIADDKLETIKDENTNPVDKVSCSTTTKKFKLDEDPVSFKTPSAGQYQDCLYDGRDTLTSGGMFTSGSNDTMDPDTTSAGVASVTIDSKFWLNKVKVQSTENAGDKDEEEEYLEMFWIDASESNGVIYLYGKVDISKDRSLPPSSSSTGTTGNYVSCCVAVQGCERNLFVLPKSTGEFDGDGTPKRAGMKDVYEELNKVLVPNVIPRTQGQGFRCKTVKRNYAFEYEDVPRQEMEYLKVVYSAKFGVPSQKQCEGNNNSFQYIDKILGYSSSPLEWFLLKRKLLGPCWLKVKNPRTLSSSVSWCKIEVGIESPKYVQSIVDRKIPNPPMVTLSLSMKTIVNPSTNVHEIVALAGLIHTKVDSDIDSDMTSLKHMKRFVFVRQLGLSCGSDYPSVFPHDINNEIKKSNNTQMNGCSIQTLPNERALLSIFSAKLAQEDPDFIVSHNLLGFELDILVSRSVANKAPAWSRLGRLRKSKPPKSSLDRDLTCGRIMCDTYKLAKEFLNRETSYSLTSLSKSQLNFDRIEIDPMDTPKFFSSSLDIIRLCQHTANDSGLVQKLMLSLQVIPLTKQLTNLSGNLWSRTMRGARAERIEYLLMHEFHRYKFILPEKKAFGDNHASSNNKTAEVIEGDADDEGEAVKVGGRSRSRAKAAYAGGLVLEPKKGLYDSFILLLDFNSLYPSLIQEYNLCFTTIDWTKFMEKTPEVIKKAVVTNSSKKGKKSNNSSRVVKDVEKDEEDDAEAEEEQDEEIEPAAGSAGGKELPPIPDTSLKMGHLPKVIKALVDRRRTVKNELKKERDPIQRQQLDIRQKALKLTANSMYGCLGFTFSRFYARPIAALVTSKGREALQRTVDLATKQLNLDVIYGDTDSVMINTNSSDLSHVKELGNLVKREVNKLYRALELDLDGIFKSMLLLKKKKYAALVIKEISVPVTATTNTSVGTVSNGVLTTIQYEKELKGLDLVRRDWCPLSQETGKYVVDQILSGKQREDIVLAIHEELRSLATKVRSGQIDISKFVVTKGLNKNPKDYPDCKGQAHLQVALQMIKDHRPVNIGDHIPYVICQQGPEGATPPQRAHHPDEIIRLKGELTIDFEWYLSNQILPPISRLCEPIEGTSAAILSEQLGLDPTKYAARHSSGNDWLEEDWGFTPKSAQEDSERFQSCDRLTVKCVSCEQESGVNGILPVTLSDVGCATGLYCPCGAEYFGRSTARDCYCYLSNRVSLLVRQSLKRYYDTYLVCDDPTCGRRTMQQPSMGLRCMGDCHGRMIQEYNAESLHTQLKYLESLFDVERLKKKLEHQLLQNSGDSNLLRRVSLVKSISSNHLEVFRLLKLHMISIAVKDSAFNWVRPSLFTAVFARSLNSGANK